MQRKKVIAKSQSDKLLFFMIISYYVIINMASDHFAHA